MFVNGKVFDEQAWYRDVDSLLSDLRSGTLKDKFRLSDKAWSDLVTRINVDPELAGEIVDRGILLMLATDRGSEIDGVMAMAEACRG